MNLVTYALVTTPMVLPVSLVTALLMCLLLPYTRYREMVLITGIVSLLPSSLVVYVVMEMSTVGGSMLLPFMAIPCVLAASITVAVVRFGLARWKGWRKVRNAPDG